MIPKVSIIVPNYNGSATLTACIQSLLVLDYPKEKLEIILVDNGSTDHSVQIIKSYPVKLVLEKDIKGSYAARNMGVTQATGDVLAFTDADCVADKQWLLHAVKHFTLKDVGGVAGKVLGTKPETLVEEFIVWSKGFDQARFFNHPYYPFAITANVIYRKIVFDKIGKFETNWISGGDVDFSWRMQIDGKMKLVYADDCIVYHYHRASVKGFYLQTQTHAYGACLLNAKYDNKFQKIHEQKGTFTLYIKMFQKYLEKIIFFFAFFLFRKQRIYFLYLSRISTLGYFKGLIQYRKAKHLLK